MKTRVFHLIAVGCTAVFVIPVSAIEAPVDDAAPPVVAAEAGALEAKPAAPAKPVDMPEAKPAEKAEVAFLGVGTTAIPEMLAEHLNLKPDEGVLVNSLPPDSPAAKAGIAINDIITRIAGQRVGSTLDVGEKVRSHKPGETIRLDVIHKGKATGLDVALGSRPQVIDEPDMQALDAMPFEAVPKDMQNRIRELKNRVGAMELKIGGLRNGERLRGMQKFEIQGGIHNGASFRMMDPNGSIEMKSNEDGKEVTIRDNNDKITWSGPWDTDQDKAAAPDDVRQRIERLNILNGNRNGFQLNMGGLLPQAAPMEGEANGDDE